MTQSLATSLVVTAWGAGNVDGRPALNVAVDLLFAEGSTHAVQSDGVLSRWAELLAGSALTVTVRCQGAGTQNDLGSADAHLIVTATQRCEGDPQLLKALLPDALPVQVPKVRNRPSVSWVAHNFQELKTRSDARMALLLRRQGVSSAAIGRLLEEKAIVGGERNAAQGDAISGTGVANPPEDRPLSASEVLSGLRAWPQVQRQCGLIQRVLLRKEAFRDCKGTAEVVLCAVVDMPGIKGPPIVVSVATKAWLVQLPGSGGTAVIPKVESAELGIARCGALVLGAAPLDVASSASRFWFVTRELQQEESIAHASARAGHREVHATGGLVECHYADQAFVSRVLGEMDGLSEQREQALHDAVATAQPGARLVFDDGPLFPLRGDDGIIGMRADVVMVAAGHTLPAASVHAREGSVEVGASRMRVPISDESWSELSGTVSSKGAVVTGTFTCVLRWTGWSQASPMPFGQPSATLQASRGESSKYIVPHVRPPAASLPPLLYEGASVSAVYRFRGRPAFVGGGGLTTAQLSALIDDSKTDLYTSPDIKIPSWSLIDPPTVFGRADRDSEAVLRQSNEQLGAALEADQYVFCSDGQGEAQGSLDLYVVPPMLVASEAVKWGVRDYARLKTTEITSRRPGESRAEHRKRIGQLFEEFSASRRVPYVVDPRCERATVRLLSMKGGDETGEAKDISFVVKNASRSDWPEGMRIQRILVLGSAQPERAAQADLSFVVPPGRRHYLRIGSVPSEWVRNSHGRVSQCRCLAPQMRRKAEDVAAEIIAPQTVITVVHAVRRPLLAPVVRNTTAAGGSPLEARMIRPPGATWATLVAAIAYDGASTGELNVWGSWTDVDLDTGPYGAFPSRGRSVSRRLLSHVTIPYPAADQGAVEQRFENVDSEKPKSFFNGTSNDGAVMDKLETQGQAVSAGIATPPLKHEFGDTRARLLSLTATATSRYRGLFAGDTHSSEDTEDNYTRKTPQAEAAQVWLNSSARPPVPVPYECVPRITFVRENMSAPQGRSGAWSIFQSRMMEDAIRIKCERPWNVSGPDEMLGVVLTMAGSTAMPTRSVDMDVLSVWGEDVSELGATGAGGIHVRKEDLAGYVKCVCAKITGPDGATVDALVALYKPRFEMGSDREVAQPGEWVTDVELSASGRARLSNVPRFCRLSLVRYQEHSEAECEVSQPAVRTSWIRLRPERRLTIGPDAVYPAINRFRLRVEGAGASGGATGSTDHYAPVRRFRLALHGLRRPGTAADEFDWEPEPHAWIVDPQLPADATGALYETTFTLRGGFGFLKRVTVVEEEGLVAVDDGGQPVTTDGSVERSWYAVYAEQYVVNP